MLSSAAVPILSEFALVGLVPKVNSATLLNPSLSESVGVSVLSNGSVPARTSSTLVKPSPSKSS